MANRTLNFISAFLGEGNLDEIQRNSSFSWETVSYVGHNA